ncbi:hypothetical protein Gotri_004631, partial [Gossypium trilobum]|nr:hypothetical protein [Gossypium trilobum]
MPISINAHSMSNAIFTISMRRDISLSASFQLGELGFDGSIVVTNSSSTSSMFFITCAKCEWLDNKHVVFGRVIGDSLLVVRKIENVATGPNNRPKLPCIIAECGEMEN